MPAGTIRVYNNGHRIATYRLSGGVVKFRLPSFTVGKHVIKVVYLGDALHAGSTTSRTITVVKA